MEEIKHFLNLDSCIVQYLSETKKIQELIDEQFNCKLLNKEAIELSQMTTFTASIAIKGMKRVFKI